MRREITLAACVLLQLLGGAGCASHDRHGAGAVGLIGGLMTASQLDMLRTQYVAGALVAYALHDPLTPNWRIEGVRIDDERVRFELQMKPLTSGGDGEARRIFMRSARRMAEAGGFAGFDVVHYEEGIDSGGPSAHRFATGEVRFVRAATSSGL